MRRVEWMQGASVSQKSGRLSLDFASPVQALYIQGHLAGRSPYREAQR
jgi:hypothetical protein